MFSLTLKDERSFISGVNEMQTAECLEACFGERLKEVRLKRGLSVSGLANAADLDRSTIHNYENKQCSPNGTTVVLLCKALEVSADYLLGLKG